MAENAPQSPRTEWIAIFEAAVLAAVAVLTAWSGYQASRWDGSSARSYALASGTTVRAQEQHTLVGQDRLYDITTFHTWLRARVRGHAELASDLERRFRPEFAIAFAAWLATDPFQNPQAPAGPVFMPEYRSAKAEAAKHLGAEAAAEFQRAVAERAAGDDYVRVTVILATVLLLTALSQRFRAHGPRVVLLGVACAMLGLALFWLETFPRA